MLRVWGLFFLDCKSKTLINASRKSSSRYCSAFTAWDEQSFEWISELGDYCWRLSAVCCVRVASRCLAKKIFSLYQTRVLEQLWYRRTSHSLKHRNKSQETKETTRIIFSPWTRVCGGLAYLHGSQKYFYVSSQYLNVAPAYGSTGDVRRAFDFRKWSRNHSELKWAGR